MADTTPAARAVDRAASVHDYLYRMPKVDLHCHLIGTVRAATFADLVRRNGVELPDTPERIYAQVNSLPPDPRLYVDTTVPVPHGPAPDEPKTSYSLFQVSGWVIESLRELEDLRRIAYEAVEDAYLHSSTRHVELSFDHVPKLLDRFGHAGIVEAYVDGLRGAERDYPVTARLIAAIDRSGTGEEAVEVVRAVVDNPHPYVVGIGLDNLETAGPPERFADAYRLAGAAGLRRTAHSSEHAPVAANTITCLDLLGCDRIDHGYFVLEDPEVVARVRDQQVPFTVISTTSRRSWRPWRRASIAAMVQSGLNVVPASDDPGMFPTTLAAEYRILADDLGLRLQQLEAMALAGIDACWLPDVDKAALRASAVAELDALRPASGASRS